MIIYKLKIVVYVMLSELISKRLPYYLIFVAIWTYINLALYNAC